MQNGFRDAAEAAERAMAAVRAAQLSAFHPTAVSAAVAQAVASGGAQRTPRAPRRLLAAAAQVQLTRMAR